MAGNDAVVRRPTRDDIEALADRIGFTLDEEELAAYVELVGGSVAAIEAVERSAPPDIAPTPAYDDRPPGHRPVGGDDPYNAWITKCTVPGAPDGPLAGLEVGLKDTIALAGYELTLGSRVFEGFVPRIDATVVTRLLSAGATIVGKQNMEAFGVSGGGDFSDFGPVLNPHDDAYLAGGSSSGSAAAVAAGDCDVAIGGDQAGSIRIPASWCGVVGLKPTTGLVPYTGVVPLNVSHDHVGPLARTVEPVARTLDAIAGLDADRGVRLDPRQPPGLEPDAYAAGLDEGADGLRIGVLEEGFGRPVSADAVDEAVTAAADVFEGSGATVRSVSVPSVELGPSIFASLGQGSIRMLDDDAVGVNHGGWYWTGLQEVARKFMAGEVERTPATLKASWLTAAYLSDDSGVRYYAKARNLALEAERQITEALESLDALLLPTTPMLPVERDPSLGLAERVRRSRTPAANTALFDLTRHPALSVPCATVDGLPVGMMLVGSHFDDRTLLRLGAAFESAVDWTAR